MMSPEWHSLDQGLQAAIKVHQEVAPIRLSAIAHALGVQVIATAMPSGISGEIRPDADNPGQFIIRVNKNDSSRRQRFTVAHELGHFLLHRAQIGDGITDDVLYRSELSDRREAQANRIAADLLMPQQLVDEWLGKARTLKVDNVIGFLADKFNVSEAAMKIRLGIP